MRAWGKGAAARPGRPGIVLAGLLAFCMAATVVIATPKAAAGWWVEVTADEVNLRAEPGEWAEPVGRAWAGEWVEVIDGPVADGWYRVQAGDRGGWAAGQFLAIEGSAVGGVAWGERWVDVNRSTQTVTLFEGETPVASYWGAMGGDGSADGFFATAVGTHYVYDKTEGLNWTDFGGGWITHWVGFDPNRANGFHSYLKDENGWPVPGGDGPTGGCVALDPAAAEHVYWFASIGTRVEVHW